MFFYFRRISTVLLCLLPVGLAVAVTLGFIVLSGIGFTPAGTGVTALILGIGIDDTFHIVTRLKGRTGDDIQAVVEEIGPVITLTSLTTVAGFSSLMLASNSLVFSFGAVITFGIAACLFFTVLLVPPLVRSIVCR
ncbi:MAG: MMPL family transporter [Candidatus Aminicenantes bacterium]|nr:MMPL family transporter [Candidatus Aminicenantes bacterium]